MGIFEVGMNSFLCYDIVRNFGGQSAQYDGLKINGSQKEWHY